MWPRAVLLALGSTDAPAEHDGMYPVARCSQRTVPCRSCGSPYLTLMAW